MTDDLRARPVLAPPYFAVRVTGALFHTRGGSMIDRTVAAFGALAGGCAARCARAKARLTHP